MAKVVKVFDPDETTRRFHVVLTEEACPGFLEFLSTVPFRSESTLVRAVIYQWFLDHELAGDLNEAIEKALIGPGGKADLVPSPARRLKKELQPKCAKKPRAAKRPPGTSRPTPSFDSVVPETQETKPTGSPEPELSLLPMADTIKPSSPVPEQQDGNRTTQPALSPPQEKEELAPNPAAHVEVSAEALEALSQIEVMF